MPLFIDKLFNNNLLNLKSMVRSQAVVHAGCRQYKKETEPIYGKKWYFEVSENVSKEFYVEAVNTIQSLQYFGAE